MLLTFFNLLLGKQTAQKIKYIMYHVQIYVQVRRQNKKRLFFFIYLYLFVNLYFVF